MTTSERPQGSTAAPPGATTTQEPHQPVDPSDPSHADGPSARQRVHDLDRLRRSGSDRRIAGVAGGLGRHLGIDPTLVRVVLVVAIFFGGAGLLFYAAAWLFVPADGGGVPLDLGREGRRFILVAAAALALLLVLADVVGGFGARFGLGGALLVLLAVTAVLLVVRDRDPDRDRDRDRAQVAAPGPVPDAPLRADDPTPPRGWTPPPPAPARPRRTGVVWFWPTLALLAITVGAMALVDADHSWPALTYAVVGLGLVGAMLIVGAFVGRPGGLIALGLVGVLSLGAAGLVDGGYAEQPRSVEQAPTSVAAVKPAYDLGNGSLFLDLSTLQDPAALDGRTVRASATAGEITMVVPTGVDVAVTADVRLAGQIDVGDQTSGGVPATYRGVLPHSTDPSGTAGTTRPPLLHLVLDAGVGQITVRHP